VVKNPPANAGDAGLIPGSGKSPGEANVNPLQYPRVRKISWRSKCQPTPVFSSGKPHGQRSLAGYSSRGRKESNTT